MSSTLLTEEKTPGCYLKARYVLGLMTALGTLNVYSLRNGINVALVAMVQNSDQTDMNTDKASFNDSCVGCLNNTLVEDEWKTNTNKFNWTLVQQTILLGSYYYGYCLTNLPGAWLAKRFGIRLVFGLTSLLSSLLTLWMPSAAKTNFGLAVTLRALIGFMQGVTFPVAITGWGLWAPPLERSRLIATTYSGVSTGVFIVYPFAGILISSLGWEALFYVTGAIGCLYSVTYLCLIHNSPADHPRISKQEREYIETSIYGGQNPEEHHAIPWLKMITSVPVWATVSAHLSANWITITMTMLIPTYIANVHGFDIRSVGIISAAPFILSFLFMLFGCFLTDFILKKDYVSRILMRKLMSSIPLTIVGCSLLILAIVDDLSWWDVVGLGLCMTTLGFATSGHVCSFVDIAPRYGGIIYSVSNTFVAIMGFVSPQVAGAIITDEKSADSWQGVFWMSAVICFLGAVIFGVFASDRVQPWAEPSCSSIQNSERLMDNVSTEEPT